MTEKSKELGFARVDLDRAARRGHPEAVYAPGKSAEQIVEITAALHEAGQTALITRAEAEEFSAVRQRFEEAEWHEAARLIVVRAGKRPTLRDGIAVLCAGTSDIPVAEEAALTAELMGVRVERHYDVGVAGLHRLLDRIEAIRKAKAIVVAAGMDGALPSVVGGLVACPVVAVPTSQGYGTGADGTAALLTMLNACAAGVSVVNIDNGYGAGYQAALIARPVTSKSSNRRKTKKSRS